jgi:hypothetical protein
MAVAGRFVRSPSGREEAATERADGVEAGAVGRLSVAASEGSIVVEWLRQSERPNDASVQISE